MNRSVFYLAAIALHVAVLLGVNPSTAETLPPKKEKKFLEVTLTSEPGPARPGPDSGPSDQPKAAAAPGPIVASPPPPVATLTPEVTPPAPTLEPPKDILPPEPPPPPVPVTPTPPVVDQPPPVESPPVSAPPPPPVIQPTPAAPASPPVTEVNPTPSTAPSAKISAAPISGTGHGNAAQWSPGAGGNGHFYRAFAVPQGITWADANKYANEHGGYLATITSAAENLFVFKLVDDPKYWTDDSDPYYDGPWLGGFKLNGSRSPAEGWYWVHAEGPFQYTNWSPPNPDNGQGFWEDSLNFWSPIHHTPRPGWNDRNGRRAVHGFVMEYDTEAAYLAGHPEIDPFAPRPFPAAHIRH